MNAIAAKVIAIMTKPTIWIVLRPSQSIVTAASR
jgi:hypothetical protein